MGIKVGVLSGFCLVAILSTFSWAISQERLTEGVALCFDHRHDPSFKTPCERINQAWDEMNYHIHKEHADKQTKKDHREVLKIYDDLVGH